MAGLSYVTFSDLVDFVPNLLYQGPSLGGVTIY